MPRAFAPGHITGFFAPHIEDDPLRSGSWGAGIAIDLGAFAELELADSIHIEGIGDARVTRKAIEMGLEEAGEKGVHAEIQLQLPTGQGFGMSAAGTLAASLALADALGMKKEDALRWAHTAEVLSGTGLSDAIGSYYGGMVIRKEPGLMPHGDIMRKEVQREIYIMVLGGPIDTSEFLRNRGAEVSEAGRRALSALLENPDFPAFMRESRNFAESIGISDVLEHIPEGFAGSQVMLGNSIFFADMQAGTVRLSRKRKEVPLKAIRCRIDNTGARVIG